MPAAIVARRSVGEQDQRRPGGQRDEEGPLVGHPAEPGLLAQSLGGRLGGAGSMAARRGDVSPSGRAGGLEPLPRLDAGVPRRSPAFSAASRATSIGSRPAWDPSAAMARTIATLAGAVVRER